MNKEASSEFIHEYTDTQAIEDGALVDVTGTGIDGRIKRVTRAVWFAYIEDMGGMGIITDVTRLIAIASTVMREDNLEDGWYICTIDNQKLWCIPNDIGSYTLMFPEDY